MSYLIPLALSALSTNGVHGYLLLSQKTKRKFTISEHAVLHSKSFVLYVLGHMFGGAFFLIFAKQYYLDVVNLGWLFGLTIFTVVFEYTQAFLPAKGKTNKLHTITALVMWTSFITLGLLSIIFVPAIAVRKVAATLVYTGLVASLLYASKDRERMYRHQMIMVLLFYVSMFVLVV